jgi:hypothetical protein
VERFVKQNSTGEAEALKGVTEEIPRDAIFI